MIKSIKAILAQDKEKFKVPRKVQDLIPIKNIWPDGIFKVGNKFSKVNVIEYVMDQGKSAI